MTAHLNFQATGLVFGGKVSVVAVLGSGTGTGGHLAHFVRDAGRDSLDLSAILKTDTEERGFPPYHPFMMTARLYALEVEAQAKTEAPTRTA